MTLVLRAFRDSRYYFMAPRSWISAAPPIQSDFSTAEDFALYSVQNGSPLGALELARPGGRDAFLNLCRPGRFDIVFRG